MQCPLPPVRICPPRGGARIVVPGTDPCTTAPLHSPLPRRVAIRFASPSRHQTRMRILYPILKPGTTKRAPPVGEMPIRAFCQLRPIRQLVRFLHPPQSILPFSKSLGGAGFVGSRGGDSYFQWGSVGSQRGIGQFSEACRFGCQRRRAVFSIGKSAHPISFHLAILVPLEGHASSCPGPHSAQQRRSFSHSSFIVCIATPFYRHDRAE